jgi:(R)-2-hydroxyacyl-CoA dehydratese activating ATPase
MIGVGIDGGSRAIKIVLMDRATHKVVASGVSDQGVDHERLARQLLDELLKTAGLARAKIKRIVATGYTRNAIAFSDTTITEITCHAVGVRHVVPDAATIIEIGGQDSKLLRLNPHGGVRDFAMNDRCAAGTGRFLEVVAARLAVRLDQLGALAHKAKAPAPISSMCVVFAETEIIGLMASGVPPADIVAGVQKSIALRVAAMIGREAKPPVIFTGGVALIPGMVDAFVGVLETPVQVAPQPQMTGAIGAALLACRQSRGA